MQAFSSEYIISLVVALLVAYLIQSGTPELSPFITFLLVPLLVAYLVLQIINYTFPKINQAGQEVNFWATQRIMGGLTNMGYIQIFPPLMILIVIFFIMLYNRQLG